MKTTEEKIYEGLGVKYFKRFVIWIQFIIFKLSKTNINKRFQFGSNYFISGGSIKKLKRFRFGLLFNTIVHAWGLFCCISSVLTGVTGTGAIINLAVCTLINIYCLMLQRYNNIRLERTIKTKQEHIKLLEDRKNQRSLEKALVNSEKLLNESVLESFIENCDQSLTDSNTLDISVVESEIVPPDVDTEYPLKMEMKNKNIL